jgi:hypothetical protein
MRRRMRRSSANTAHCSQPPPDAFFGAPGAQSAEGNIILF